MSKSIEVLKEEVLQRRIASLRQSVDERHVGWHQAQEGLIVIEELLLKIRIIENEK